MFSVVIATQDSERALVPTLSALVAGAMIGRALVPEQTRRNQECHHQYGAGDEGAHDQGGQQHHHPCPPDAAARLLDGIPVEVAELGHVEPSILVEIDRDRTGHIRLGSRQLDAKTGVQPKCFQRFRGTLRQNARQYGGIIALRAVAGGLGSTLTGAVFFRQASTSRKIHTSPSV